MRNGSSSRLKQRDVQLFVKQAESGEKKYGSKLSDGGGLMLSVNRSGKCSWLYRYTQQGKTKDVSIGTYPEFGLDAARVALVDLKRDQRAGHDIAAKRRVERAQVLASYENTFAAVADLWLEKERPTWKKSHYTRTRRALERDIYPALGKLPVDSITAPMVAKAIEKIAKRNVRDTADKILQNVKRVFRYAIALGHIERNPADTAGEVLTRKTGGSKGHPALLDLTSLHAILRTHETVRVRQDIKTCSLLIAHTAVRIENACAAEWAEFDFEGKMWRIPAAKMKRTTADHTVPLSDAVIELLKRWKAVSGGRKHLFPSETKSGYISKEGVEKFYREQLQLRDKGASKNLDPSVIGKIGLS